MPSVSLHELITALTGAVVQAQDAVQQHQLMLLGQFFDETGAPKSVIVAVPNPSSDPNQPATLELTVPRISLVEATMLHITEFEVSFDVELGDLNTDSIVTTTAVATGSDGLDHADGPEPSTTSADSDRSVASVPARQSAKQSFVRRLLFGGAPGSQPNSFPSSTDTTQDNFGSNASSLNAPRAAPDGALDNTYAAAMLQIAPQMDVDMGPASASSARAKATLKVSAKPLSDGMVRMLNHLNKTF